MTHERRVLQRSDDKEMHQLCLFVKRAAVLWTIVGIVNILVSGWLVVERVAEKRQHAKEVLEHEQEKAEQTERRKVFETWRTEMLKSDNVKTGALARLDERLTVLEAKR